MKNMAEMDVIILSNAHLPLLEEYTRETIRTCIQSDAQVKFNFVVIEQQEGIDYDVPTYHVKEPFNYNRFMNFGISKGKSEFVVICNNDLFFQRSWASNIIVAMRNNNLLSACPICPHTQGTRKYKEDVNYGYAIREEVSGWCWVLKREVFEIIGEIKWHPQLPFWYSDNILARQLKSHGIKHALIKNSIVTHRGSQTINRKENNHDWTMGSWAIFDRLCKQGVL